MKTDLFKKATKEKVFMTDGIEFARTVPVKSGEFAPFAGFIKTTIGEHKVFFNSEVLHDLFMGGDEISEEKYVKTKLTVINNIAV